MNTNEEYLDSLLRDFEKAISEQSEAEEAEQEKTELLQGEEQEKSETEATDTPEELTEETEIDTPEEPEPELPEEFVEEPEVELSEEPVEEPENKLPEEPQELQEELPVEAPEEDMLEEIKGMSVDEETFFDGETQDYEKLDPLVIESMKKEWESGLDVEEFGFSKEDFSLDEEDLKFEFSETETDENTNTDVLGEAVSDEAGMTKADENIELPQEAAETTQVLQEADENIESSQKTGSESENEDIAALFDLLEEAESSAKNETDVSEESETQSDLDIDFTNMFGDEEPQTDMEDLNLEYMESEEADAKTPEGESASSFFQKLVQEKEEPIDEEALQKKIEEKEAAKAEKAEAKAAKKAERAEAKKARQEAKRVKKEAEKAEPKEPFSFKAFFVIALFGATIMAGILVLSSILSYHPYISNARTYFDAREYKKAYEELEGIEIKEKDSGFYTQVRTMEKLSSKISAFENFNAANQDEEALSSLIEGVALYDEKAEYAESIGLKTEYQLVFEEITGILQEKYNISLEEARTMVYKFGTSEYKLWIQEHI